MKDPDQQLRRDKLVMDVPRILREVDRKYRDPVINQLLILNIAILLLVQGD